MSDDTKITPQSPLTLIEMALSKVEKYLSKNPDARNQDEKFADSCIYTLKYIIEHYGHDKPLLHHIVTTNNLKTLMLLLESGMNISTQQDSGKIMQWCIEHYHEEMAISLIEHRADVNVLVYNKPLLYHAITRRLETVAMSMIERGGRR